MRQKGVADPEIDAAMAAQELDWYGLAEETYHRKFGTQPATGIKEKARRSRFMQYRGFDVDHYRHLLDE
jgi:regulatory protein